MKKISPGIVIHPNSCWNTGVLYNAKKNNYNRMKNKWLHI